MKIKIKVLMGLAIMAGLLLVSGLIGINGVQQISGSLRFVTTSAWDAADGAMEGTIGIQSEIISLQKSLLAEIEPDQALKDIKFAEGFGGEALERMVNSGLMQQSQVDELHQRIKGFRQARDELIASHQSLEASKSRGEAILTKIDDILMISEDTLEKQMDGGQLSSFNSIRIQALWDMADAIMETRISLLRRGHILSMILSSDKSADNAKKELPILLSDASELVKVLQGSELSRTRVPGGQFKVVLAKVFNDYKSNFNLILDNFEKFKQAKEGQEIATTHLLDLIEAMEESGDAKVEEEASIVEPKISNAVNELIGITVLGFVFSLVAFILSQKLIVSPIQNVSSQLQQISHGEGDLTVRLDASGSDELAELAEGFNGFVEKTQAAIQQVQQATVLLHQSSENLARVSQQTVTGIHQQQSETNMAATAMTEMSATVTEVSRSAASASVSAQETNQQASEGYTIVSNTVNSINLLAGEVEKASGVIHRLESESESIGSVLDVIRGIAEQTNLLALNAAIEAARAGEQGRGFAVVADEVRTLAGRTQQSTSEIQEMIERLQAGTGEAVQVMSQSKEQVDKTVEQAQKAGDALSAITSSVSAINDMNTQIATASEEQASVTEGVTENVNNINNVASQTSDGAEQISQATTNLVNISNQLDELVSQFKV